MNNFGNYEIICEIGQGGMAQVFKARENILRRIVAIKKIKENFLEDEKFLKMFKDEAIISANLNHPNIISIYELGKLGNSYYISMEYVEGKSLKKIIESAKVLGEKISLNLSLFILMEVAKALQFAHHLNVIHRDVSPSNILVSYQGRVKLVDFGIAKAKHSISSSTRVGILKGKLNYLAPEQARGEKVDCRADIFALGIVMFELITGRTLFAGESDLEILEKVRNAKVEDALLFLSDVPAGLKNIIGKCLQEDREKRYQDISSFIVDAESLIRNSGAVASEGELGAYLTRLFGGKTKDTEGRESEMAVDWTSAENPQIIYQTKVTKLATTVRARNLKLFFICGFAGVFIVSLLIFLNTGHELPAKTDKNILSFKNIKETPLPQKLESKRKNFSFPGNIKIEENKKEILGTIFIKIHPSDAIIYLDNVLQGEGDRVLKGLKIGKHTIKIKHPDYEDEIYLINVTSEKQKFHLLYRNGEIIEEKNANF